MTDMPQMIALYNGMGGGAAAAIAAVELYRGETAGYASTTLAVVGGIIGAVSFSGSAIAFGKLQGLITRSIRFRGQQILNLLLLAAALVARRALVAAHVNASPAVVTAFFVLALVLGVSHDAADRRRRHAGGDLALQRAHRARGRPSRASCSTTPR